MILFTLKRVRIGLVIAFLVAMTVAAALLVMARSPRLYKARGTFYFGFHGREAESLSIEEWSGPDHLCMFKEHLWECRPADFVQRVIVRLHDEYGWTGNEGEAIRAVKSIEFQRCPKAFAMIELIVESSGPSLAADVANASMDEIENFELAYEERRRNKVVDAFENECRHANAAKENAEEKLRLAESDEDKRRLTQAVAHSERIVAEYKAKIAAYKAMDVHTNTMFKVMIRADAQRAVAL